jgi:uncharacterized protein YdgA (DUF945 family)
MKINDYFLILDEPKYSPFFKIGDFEKEFKMDIAVSFSSKFSEKIRVIPICTAIYNNCETVIFAFFFGDIFAQDFACIGFIQKQRLEMKFKWNSIEMAKKVREFVNDIQEENAINKTAESMSDNLIEVELIVDNQIPDTFTTVRWLE